MKNKSLKHLALHRFTISNLSKIKGGSGEEGDENDPDEGIDLPQPPPTNSCATRGCWSMNRICV